MIKKRIGNDVNITWIVNNPDGTPIDFTGVQNMHVYVKRSNRSILIE